jgi:cephalosporin hydroxylase
VIVQVPPRPDRPDLPGQADPPVGEDVQPNKVRPPRADAQDGVMFSIIVNFYNMPREAARTLTSLSRLYQRDIGALRYEVLCVDNYSNPPIEAGWVDSFGPEFRLIRPSRKLPSPVEAINEAAAQARGKYIAVMIDGAHLLTPGVLREVWDAVTEAPDATVALRQWFVGGDQRWLAEAGYTRAHEDILFDKIAWPEDGYLLFREGAPFWESPRPWFDAMIESNCLFMPAWLYREIGGMAEDFSEAGAGYANLDLFRRAIEASPEPPVALIGEATFHQFHDGTTTNVTVEMKEQRVRRYESHYVALRGQAYPVTNAVDIRLRGQIRNLHTVASWQRPGMPGRVGVTERVRPGSLVLQFDETAQTYLNSVYVENRLQDETRWRGQALGLAPTDAMAIQELVSRLRPGRIVVTNARHGLLVFLDDVLHLLDLPGSRIIATGDDPAAASDGALPDRVVTVPGAARRAETIAAVETALAAEEVILVLFAPDAGDFMPFDTLRAYAAFVSPRSYLVFLGTALGQPWLGYSQHWYVTAIRRLLDTEPFAIDRGCNPHLVSTSPFGYLQRIELPPHFGLSRSGDSGGGAMPDAELDHG